jgi:RimJ/RimL family protein N-acetyltransferase
VRSENGKTIINGNTLELRERVKKDLERELIWKKDREICYLEGLEHEGYKIPDYDETEWSHISQTDEFNKENLVFSIYIPGNIHIGSAGFFSDSQDRRSGEVGIIIGESDYRGKGYGTEAVKLFINYLFETKKVKKLYGVIYKFNERAYKTALKTGFIEKKVISKYHREYGFYEKSFLEIEAPHE